ncbi:MAG: hypothetical protein KAK00_09280 [Nanoarchaeota archaeon]|nr:hypothetical protein [Nanoarchaeota archaeon]
MALYTISYDLGKPNRDYGGLFDELKKFDNWWHYLESTWIIKTSKEPNEIFDKLKPHLDNDDNLLVIEAGKKSQGRLSQKAWDWIKKNSLK